MARPADRQDARTPGRGIRSSSRAAASRAGRTASRSRRPTSSTTRPGRSTARCSASGVADGNIVLMTEEDFTGPCDPSGRIVAADITDSLGGEPATNSTPAQPYRMNALSAFHPTQDAGDTTAPSGSCSAHYFEVVGLDARGRLVRPGAAPHRRLGRSQPAAGRLLLRDRHRPGDEPELAVVGRRLARRPDLPLRHEPRGRDPAPGGRPVRVRERCRRCRSRRRGRTRSRRSRSPA